MGGGIGIPYRPGQKPVDIDYVSRGVKTFFDTMLKGSGMEI